MLSVEMVRIPSKEIAFITSAPVSTLPQTLVVPTTYSVPTNFTPSFDFVETRAMWFSFATFHEEDKEKAVAALEDAIRPPWMSEDYRNDNIGAKVYEPLLGCGALVDLVSLKALQDAATKRRKKDPSVPVPLGVSVADAASVLVSRYSSLNEREDISGAVYSWQITKRAEARMSEVLDHFHKYVSGPYEDLEGLHLKDVPLRNKFGKTEETPRPVAARLDPRAARSQVVAEYAKELDVFRGLRG